MEGSDLLRAARGFWVPMHGGEFIPTFFCLTSLDVIFHCMACIFVDAMPAAVVNSLHYHIHIYMRLLV